MAAQRSGQVTVTTAGTAVQGPDFDCDFVQLVAHPSNTDSVWVGVDSTGADVANTTGFPLTTSGNQVVMDVANLTELYFDAEVNGEKVCWVAIKY